MTGLFAAGVVEKQPYMKAALTSLQKAKGDLQKASPDKGGHRAKAIELINKAITEVRAGIAYDNTHKEKPKPAK